jgi:hypothetical protein
VAKAKGFPWDVLAGSTEYEGLGARRLTTEVTKTRLRVFQAMAVSSRFTSENDTARAMLYVSQRWCGASTPVNMLHAGDLRLLRPQAATAPRAAHM